MNVAISTILIVLGAIFVCFGRQIARARVSLHFSDEELRATIGPAHRRVRRTRTLATIGNIAIGAAFVYAGLRGLLR